jgi:hypothetical protein
MTLPVFYSGDVYEINFTSEGVESILKYRHGLDGRGELVDYDTLPPQLQIKIFDKLSNALRTKQDENGSQ